FDQCGVGYSPEGVRGAIAVLGLSIGLSSRTQQAFDFARGIAVQHENLAKMRPGRFEQFKPVQFWLGKRLLMAEDSSGGIVLHPSEGDEARPLDLPGAVRRLETLAVEVKRGLALLKEYSLAAPFGKEFGSTRVDIFFGGITRFRLSQDD